MKLVKGTVMRRSRTAAKRKTEHQVLATSNIYEELRDHQKARDAVMREQIEKCRQLQRICEAKMTFLNNEQESHGAHYRPGSTAIVFSAIGYHGCAIGDMPGWQLSPDTWLEPNGSNRLPRVWFALGVDGKLYSSRRLPARDSFTCVEDHLMSYSVDQLAHLADSIEAGIAKSAQKMIDLMIARGNYVRAGMGDQ